MLSTCAQAFALELQASSLLPFQQTTDLVEKLRAQTVEFEELIIPDEIHDLLRWSDWVRAHRATAEFFDRRLAASGERQ
jgi:dipeptidyl aminopeptidase/acylaminoacyl peptidase